jgi:cytochrome b involved in lipid metabolism
MRSKFLRLFFSLFLFVFLISPAYAQEDTGTAPEEDTVEIQIMQTEEETDETEVTEEEVVELPVYTKEEVAEHDTPGDCWMSFEGAVYDLSEYVPDHDRYLDIRDWCGRDMTADFKDKAGEDRDHKASSYALLERYKIGTLKGDFDLVDAQVIVDDVIQDTEVEEIAPTSKDYNIVIPFVLTTVLYWGMYFLVKKKILGLSILKFNGLWNTVLLLTLLLPAMGFGIFMMIRTKKPELWDIDFDFMYWHVELSLVMGFVATYHFIQRFRQYALQLKKKKSV